MYCPNCGNKMTNRICEKCGCSINYSYQNSNNDSLQTERQRNEREYISENRSNSNAWVAPLVFSIIFDVVGVILIFTNIAKVSERRLYYSLVGYEAGDFAGAFIGFAFFIVGSIFMIVSKSMNKNSSAQKNIKERPYISEIDREYINLVYNSVDKWDVTAVCDGETFSINKISFFDFANQGRIAFYVNYPIAGYCGYYLNLDDNSMERISLRKGDNTTGLWNKKYSSRNAATGVNWNSKASRNEKLLIIQEAYYEFLGNIIN